MALIYVALGSLNYGVIMTRYTYFKDYLVKGNYSSSSNNIIYTV